MNDLTGWLDDVRHAGRRLARTPLFTLAALAILALGIGANAATFSVVDAAAFRPPPFERPDEVVSIYQDSDEGVPSTAAFPAYRDVADLDVFSGVAATSAEFGGAIWELPDGPRTASATYATASYFPVLGLQPTLGSWFAAEHDRVGAGTYAVVTHRTWRTQMGGDPAVIGSTVRLNGNPVTIIGVGPASFNGPAGALAIDFWLSISSTSVGGEYRVTNLDRREDHWYAIVARLAPGVSIEQARAATDALALRMGELYPDLDRGRGLTIYTLDEMRLSPTLDGVLLPVGLALLAVAGLVLVLACSNLANLMLVRGVARSREMTVRQALGAAPARIARLFLVEALLLSALGGLGGVLLARWAIDLFPRLPIPLLAGTPLDVTLDSRVLIFSALLAVASGLVFGLLPSAQAWRAQTEGGLREDLRSTTDARGGVRVRNGLVAVQMGASIVLLIGAGLFARSLANVRGVDPGVDADRIAILGVDMTRGGASQDVANAMMEDLRERVAALPGADGVALTTRLPVGGGGGTTTIVEGYEPPTGTGVVELQFAYVSPGYFDAMGIPLLEGRDFSSDDRPENPRVIVVNETAARMFWGGEAIGKRTRSQGADTPWREVVGVVADVKVASLQEAPTPQMFFSRSQVPGSCCFVVARTEGNPEALVSGMRAALAEVAPSVPANRVGTFDEYLGDGFAAATAAASLMGAFSAIALVLATLGVYAVVSFGVTRRATEIGIRVALGGTRSRVTRVMVKDSLLSSGTGVAVGLAVALALAPRLEGLLFQVGSADPITFAGAALFLFATAMGASWVPAWRAARAHPAEVLRAR